MKSWAQGLKQWGLWLLGEGSLPDSRARKMLAGTLAAVAVLVAAGVLAVGGSSKTNTASHNSTNLATAVGSGSAGTDDSSDGFLGLERFGRDDLRKHLQVRSLRPLLTRLAHPRADATLEHQVDPLQDDSHAAVDRVEHCRGELVAELPAGDHLARSVT